MSSDLGQATDRRFVEPSWRSVVHALLATLEQMDPYTGGHSRRVQAYATKLATALEWDDYAVSCTSTAALLHDLGKLVVGRATLNNTRTTMTAQQRFELLDHPYHGARIAAASEFPPEVVQGIFQHHERMDGRVNAFPYPAYPLGVVGEAISPIARVIAICDTFDAMTTQRSYNTPITTTAAGALLLEAAGTRHDAHFTQVFVEHVLPNIQVTTALAFTS